MKKIIQYLIYFHIILICFQFVFRQIFFDTTFYRDIILFLIVLLFLIDNISNKNIILYSNKFILNNIYIYLYYGIIVILFSLSQNEILLDTLLNYRNHFFPAILFIISFKIFKSEKERNNLVKFINFLFFLFSFDIIIEFILIKNNFNMSNIPWYAYTFSHSNRYTSGPDPDFNAIPKESTEILGILGWTHATSAFYVGIFSFCISNFKIFGFKNKGLLNMFLLFLFSLIIILLLGVKTSILTFIFIFLIYLFLNSKIKLKNTIIYFIAIFIFAILTKSIWFEYLYEKYEKAFLIDDAITGNTVIVAIFNYDVLKFVLNEMTGSPLKFLFGGSISSLLENTYLELRLLLFTVQFGFCWLFIFLKFNFDVIISAIKNVKNVYLNHNNINFTIGTILMMISFILDTFHYARLMYYPCIDVYFVIIGAYLNINHNNKNTINENRVTD